MTKRHVAGSGARAGQWVTCNATGICRLGGSHITEREFYGTKAWLAEHDTPKKNSEIDADDVKTFLEDTEANKNEWARKAETQARKDKGLIGHPDAQVFDDEENLVIVTKPKTASSKVFKPNSPSTVNKPSFVIPEVDDYIETGNIESLKKANRKFKFQKGDLESISKQRVARIGKDPLHALYTDKENGTTIKPLDMPEIKEYIATGNKQFLKEAERKYDISLTTISAINARIINMDERESKLKGILKKITGK